MAKCALHFLLFVAIASVANAARSKPKSSQIVQACSEALGAEQKIAEFCAADFLKGKEAEFADNDWKKMSRAAISQGEAKAVALEKTVANMAKDKSVPALERATLNLCLESLKVGAEQLSKAAAEFIGMKTVSDVELNAVQIKVDNGKFNQGKCDELLEGHVSLSSLKEQVHEAYMGSWVVSKFLLNVKA